MVKKRKSGSENIETVRESDRPRKRANLVPAGRPQVENSTDLDSNEQLRTEVEELQRQVLELRESKHLDERSIQGWEWLARMVEENPDPVLQVSQQGVIQYRNPASFALCRQWNPFDELIVPPTIHQIIEAAYASTEVIRQEMTVGERTYLVTVAPAPAPAKYVNIYASDITARKRAEEVLKVKDSAIASSLNAIAMADLQGRLTYVNPAFLRLWGYDEEREVLGRCVLEFWEEPRRASEVMQAIQNGGGWVGELVAVRKNGAHRNLYLSASTVLDDKGAPICMMASFADVTERKQAEEALRESEAKFRSVLDNSQDVIYRFNLLTGRFDYISPSCRAVVGYSAAELMALDAAGAAAMIHPDDLPAMRAALATLAQTGTTEVEYRQRTQSGEYRWMSNRLSLTRDTDGRPLYRNGNLRDITARKRAEEALRESEERLHLALGAARMGAWEWEVGTEHVVWSPELYALLGYGPAEVAPTHQAFRRRIHPQDLARWEQAIRGSMERCEDYSCEFRVVWADGSVHWVEARGRYAYTGIGGSTKIMWMRGVMADIEQRKQAEEALRESEERLRFVVESSPDTIFVQDRDLHYVWMNRPAYPLTREKLVGHTDMEMLLPEDAARLREIKQRVLAQGQRQTAEVHLTWEGQIRFYEATFQPWRDAAGAIIGVAGYARDITERKQTEEELRKLTATLESKVMQRTAQLRRRAQQLQKLTLEMSEAEDRERKRLAAILHDDVQQIIAAAKYQLSALRNRVKDDASVQAIGSQIDQMLKEAVEKSRGLSHEMSPAALSGDFAEALDQLARQMQAKHGLVVQVHATGQVRLQSDAVKAFVYRAAQELLFNAVKHAQVKEAEIRVRRLGPCLCLTVSDHGRGFDPQELRETPGFGLLSIRERIELLGGRMKIKSAKGKGSTFFLIVPDGETAVG